MKRLLFWLKYTMKNSQSRLLVTLTLVISVLILSLGLASYAISKSILMKEMAVPELTKLTIDRDLTDQFVKNVDMTAVQVILHTATTEFLQSSNNDFDKITNITNFLNAASISNNIESIYIYDIEKERIAASNPVGYISNMNLLADRDWLKDIDSITGMVVKERLNKSRKEMYISLFRPILLNAQKKGILVINIPVQKFFSSQIYVENDFGRSHFVFDAAFEPILAKDTAGLQEAQLGNAVKHADTAHNPTFYSNGQKYLLYVLKSDYTSWSFVSVLPEQQLFKGMYWIRNAVLLVSVLFAIVSVALIVITNNKMLRPIRRMRKLLIPIEKTYNEPELLDLENLTTKILNDHSFMSKQIKTSMPEIRKRFLEDACFEQADAVELYQKWKDHFADWQQGPLYIATISIDHYMEWSKPYSLGDSELLLYALGNITAECFNESNRSVMVQHGKEGFYLLLQPNHENADDTEGICGRVVDEALRYLNMSVSIGLSEPTHDVLHLSQSYRQSNIALFERLYHGYGNVYIAKTQEERVKADVDEALIQAVCQPLQTGNDSQAWLGVDRLFNAISEKNYSPVAVMAALEKLQISLEKTAEGLGRPIQAAMKPYFYPKINSMDIHDLRNYFNGIVSQILSKFQEKQVSKTNMTIQGMIDFMLEHLSENIGVKDISDSAQLSVYQANQLFKQETGQTVYDYFTKLRIEHSEMLLKETDYKIFEIAEMVGYQNENSFIRVFRNMKSMTPGKYRDWLKEQS
ncbi:MULTISPECIES: helix-turn-helix domain-containing protein [unclassified Paenibacillus]|uniref:helix-turn-helix domain-containing protein n=1 Tax=unclassified Paenibacillus TaxID=185978 RepID=UPI00363A094B